MKKLWKRFRHWLCKVGLCNLDKCSCGCHCKGRPAAYHGCCKGTPKNNDHIYDNKKSAAYNRTMKEKRLKNK